MQYTERTRGHDFLSASQQPDPAPDDLNPYAAAAGDDLGPMSVSPAPAGLPDLNITVNSIAGASDGSNDLFADNKTSSSSDKASSKGVSGPDKGAAVSSDDGAAPGGAAQPPAADSLGSGDSQAQSGKLTSGDNSLKRPSQDPNEDDPLGGSLDPDEIKDEDPKKVRL